MTENSETLSFTASEHPDNQVAGPADLPIPDEADRSYIPWHCADLDPLIDGILPEPIGADTPAILDADLHS